MNAQARSLLLLALCLIALGVGAITYPFWAPREAPATVELYYADPQAMFLVPVDVALPMPEAPPAWAAELFARLGAAPDPSLVAVVGDAKLVEAAYTAPQWKFTLQLGAGEGSAQERLLVGALVRSTLASSPEAERVVVRLVGRDGKPYESQHLDLSRPFTAADFENRLDERGAGLAATVWWPLPKGEKLVPVSMPLSGQAGSLVRDAFARLVAGPPPQASAFVAPAVPAGLAPTFGALHEDVAEVELAQAPTGSAGGRFVAASVLTLTELPGVRAVRFTHDGHPLQGEVAGFKLGEPIARPARVNEVSPAAWASP